MSNKDKKENKNLEVNVNVSYGNEVNPETIYLNSSDYKGLSREENGNIYILTTDDKYFFTNDKSVDINNVKVNGEDYTLYYRLYAHCTVK